MKRFITLSSSLLSILLFSLTAHSSYSGETEDLKDAEGKSILASSSTHIAFKDSPNQIDEEREENILKVPDNSPNDLRNSSEERDLTENKEIDQGIKNRPNVLVLTEEDIAIDPLRIEQRRVEKPFNFKVDGLRDSTKD